MKKFAFPLSIPVVLALVLAVVAAANPVPAEANGIPAIVDLPAVEATSCKALIASQVGTSESLATAFAQLVDDQDCLDAWTGARAVCRSLGNRSKACRNAKAAAVEVCMIEPDEE